MNKRILIAAVVAGMFLCGCGPVLKVSNRESEIDDYAEIFDRNSSYFERYYSEKTADTCKVEGIIHQEGDRNGVLTHLTTEAEDGIIAITGSMVCTDGDIRLIYLSPDGTETLVASGTSLKIDRQIDVAEGEGRVCFAGDGKSATCEFLLNIEARDGVSFSDIMEEPEKPVISDKSEKPEIPEIPDIPMAPENVDISGGVKEVENTWPVHVSFQADGVYGNPISTEIEIERPMTLSLDCVTLSGKLKLKIENQEGGEICADLDNPDGEYTVKVDKAGTYRILFYAKEHVGSVEITPAAD